MSEVQESGTGRKKSFEPNLVPFIDLMSVLITFLLLTAVWTQVSMIQIGTSIYGKKTENSPPPPIPEDASVPLRLDVKPTGYTLVVAKNTYNIPKLADGNYDEASLLQQLQYAHEQYPNKKDAAVAMADELPYEFLIKAMDIMIKAQFPQLSVLTGGPN